MDREEQLKREKLNRLLIEDRDLTAYWYERMSGSKNWMIDEKMRVARRMDQLAAQINRINVELAQSAAISPSDGQGA